jgi:hypothetical protein
MAGTADVSALNKRSAKVATFLLKFALGRIGSYTYTQKKENRQLTQHKFEAYCMGKKAETYCFGIFKVSAEDVKKASQQYTNGSVWN